MSELHSLATNSVQVVSHFQYGCSDWFSALPTNCNTSFSVNPSVTNTFVNVGSPFVTVPVLSKTTVSTDCVFSKCSPPLKRTPISADRPDPAIIDVGVARPSAHGQAITKIEITRSEEHTSELQSRFDLVCRLL